MAEKELDSETEAGRKRLEECRKTIRMGKPSMSTAGDSVDRILSPSDRKDWQKIRYYNRMNKDVKDEFGKNKEDFSATLIRRGKCGTGNAVGQHWDKMLSDKIEEIKQDGFPSSLLSEMQTCCIKEEEEDTSSTSPSSLSLLLQEIIEEVEILLFKEIIKNFQIILFESHFPLYGYMYSKTEESPKVYLWYGDADAVGWYKDKDGVGRYVIVDWKVLDILEFWEKNPDAYGKYLHQCLVYARLLQLHLQLDYLPHILIVPINGLSGQDIHPALFYDYPEECKELMESFEWSTTLPTPAQKIEGKRPWPFNNWFKSKKGTVDRNMLLSDFFDKDAKVGDLLKAFGWHSFEVI